LNQSGCFDVENVDDKKEFEDTREAMNFIGFTKENQEEIFRLIAGILWLGNVSFLEKDGKSQIEDSSGFYFYIFNMKVIEFASYLLGIDNSKLEQFLCFRLIQTRGGHGSLIRSPQTAAQAGLIRDSLAKALYDRIFNYIVAKINAAMYTKQADLVSINVLDIYGFEIFDVRNLLFKKRKMDLNNFVSTM
jgi:myosin I